VVGNDALLRAVWPHEAVDPAAVETTVARVRRRLRGTGLTIDTVRRRGYVLRCAVADCETTPNLSGAVLA
jgi:DNA-binding winged helix-turn-helix (wHTH) protein